jgi:hypothetical protein
MNRKEILELEEFELNKRKSDSRVMANLTLLGISITLFGLIITINPKLLDSALLAYQLVLSIPFFTSSTFARSKMAYTRNARKWDLFGFITFILAYGFLINSIGLLLANFASNQVVVTFFVINIILAISYSSIQVWYDKSKLKGRIFQDLTFTILIILLGILPALRVY